MKRHKATRPYRFTPTLVSLESRETPATLLVTSLGDGVSPNADFTLREAINTINNGDTSALSTTEKAGITGTLGVNDTIVFASLQGTITLTSPLTPQKNMILNGPGLGRISVSGNNSVRHFSMTSNNVHSISGLTLTAGKAIGNGGSIFLDNSAQLTLTDMVITGSSASGSGGAIYAASNNGKLTIERSTIAGSTAGTSGGGLWSRSETLIQNSLFTDNTAAGTAGGAINFNASNVGRVIRNSTLAGNSAKSIGGGIALESADGTLTVQNSTIVFNTANTGGGGGIARDKGNAAIDLASTIVAANTSTATANEDLLTTGTVTAASSGIGTTAGVATFTPSGTTSGLLGQDFKLGKLGNYGGPVATVNLLAGSPLINTGSNPAGLTTDGRTTLFARSGGAGPDVGAYEVNSLAITVSSLQDFVDSDYSLANFTLREALEFTNANPGRDIIGFNALSIPVSSVINLVQGEFAITEIVDIVGQASMKLAIDGGGKSRIFNTSAAPTNETINIVSLTLQNGKADDGGAMLIGDERVTLAGCIVKNSTATTQNGGGIYITGPADVVIQGSVFSGNQAVIGGAISFSGTGGSLTISNSTLTQNSATNAGGAVAFATGPFPTGNGLILRNSTIAANSASNSGGGIARTTTLPMTIESSIISGNSASTSADLAESLSSTVQISASAIGVSPTFTFTGSGNLPFGSNLKLGSLADNGGAVPTMLPAADSPVRDAGSNSAVLPFDARGSGFPRTINTLADIGAVEAATLLVVRNTNDSGKDSLRQQILDANGTQGPNSITFDASIFNTTKTITLAAEIRIDDALTLDGPGANLVTISGNSSSRIFNTSDAMPGALITLEGLTLTKGTASSGSAVYMQDENVTISDSVVSQNNATNSGSLFLAGAGKLTILRSTLQGNSSSSSGAVCVQNGTLLVDSCTFLNNVSTGTGPGGAILAIDSPGPGKFTVRNSTFSGNSAGGSGGAIGFANLASGDSALITHSTIVGNSAASLNPDEAGGGIGIAAGKGSVTLLSSVVAGNLGYNKISSDLFSGDAAFDISYSAIGDANGFSTVAVSNNLPTGIDFKLGGLENNFGPTLTMLPAVDSPLRGKGSNPGGLPLDQRGLPRTNALGNTDIGAVSVQTTSVAFINRNATNAVTAAASVSWRVNLSNSVQGLTAANFALSGAGAVGASISSVTGSGNSYVVTAATGADGLLTLEFVNALGMNFTPVNLPFAGQSYTVDKGPLVVTSITPSISLINDFQIGANKLSLSVTYSEAMDPTISPSFGLPATLNGTLVPSTGSWISANQYQQFFNVNDVNVSLSTVPVVISGGRDTGGTVFGTITFVTPVLVDTLNPIVTGINRNAPVANNLNLVSWTVSFSEAISSVSFGSFALVNGGLTGSPVITSVGGAGNSVTVTAATGGGSGTLSLVMTNPGTSTDFAGNPLGALPVIGGAYQIDHISPAASKLTLSTLLVNDTNVGPNGFTATLKYSEIMNQSVAPAVSFPAEFPASLTFNGGVWIDAQTYQAKFSVADLGVTQNDIDIRFSGAVDVVGNVQAAFTAADAFDIDTQNPVIASITSNSPDGTYLAGDTVNITLNFTEEITLTGSLEVMLNSGAIVSIPGPQTGTSLSGVYTVAAGESTGDLNVTSFGIPLGTTLRDAAGNTASFALPTSNLANNSAIVIGSNPAPLVSGFVVNDGATQRSRLTKVTVNFTNPVDAALFQTPGAVAFYRTAIPSTNQGSIGTTVNNGNGLLIAPTAGMTNSLTLTFANVVNDGVEFGSLADGRWQLIVGPANYFSPNGPGDTQLRRLFGDFDNNGTVDATDFSFFPSFGATSSSPFDFNNNSDIDSATDFGNFGNRFGIAL